jgi:hypothetical protein
MVGGGGLGGGVLGGGGLGGGDGHGTQLVCAPFAHAPATCKLREPPDSSKSRRRREPH